MFCSSFDIDQKESKNEYWLDLGRDEIKRSLHLEQGRMAKNVILFLGDGICLFFKATILNQLKNSIR